MLKKIIYIVILLPIIAIAQSTDQNWVKSKTYKVPTATSIATPTPTEAVVQVNYYDGLGRPIQQIAHAQSNTGKDIVTHIEYDAFGRMEKEFLPYVNQSASLNYNASANSEVFTFYDTPAYENTLNPFSQKQFEASPTNQILKQAAPGEPWKMTSGHEIKFDYQTNIENEVKKYKATASWNTTNGLYEISFTEVGHYAKNELYKTIIKDENWTSGNNNTTQEFKNKEGQVILKRTFNDNEAHDTYYTYDQFGNLTYVIPPAVSGVITQTVLDNMCYQYKYDYRNRLVEKKLPGKQWEYIVYDKLDRVVATGPAYNPYGTGVSGWLITKYDVMNRPVYTAWLSAVVASPADRKILQTTYNSATIYSESKTTSVSTIDGISVKYTNNVSPSTFILLTVNYYDNYDYPNAPSVPTTLPDSSLPITTNVKGLATGNWVRVLDVPGSTTNELTYSFYDTKFRPVRSYTKNYLGGYTQIDSKLDWSGKTIYTITRHRRTLTGLQVQTKDSFEYSSQDRLIKHYQQVGGRPEQLISFNTYDELGQLTSKKVGGEDITGSNSLQKVDYSYNIRGWLKGINDVTSLVENDLFAFKINYNQLESGSNTSALFNGNISETLWRTDADNVKRKYEYQYDNLNRLLEANYYKPEVSGTLDNYLEKLTYDKNGNIQSVLRNGNVDPSGGAPVNEIDNLVYTYDNDNLNLLLKVNDLSNSPQGFNQNNDILSGDIDEGGGDHSNDYTYDSNGNLKEDTNKGIVEITYNHLNLLTSVKFVGTTNGTITYIYNAIGQKIKKVVNEGVDKTTEYFGGYQYEKSILQFFPHAEGYVRAVGITDRRGTVAFYEYSYVFNYTDHLGNVRMSYALDPANNETLKILEENHYYPFGLKHQNYNVDKLDFETFPDTGVEIVSIDNPMYKYKYNGKELQEELGLNMYDYGARNYDPSLGRWMNIDPLAEKGRRWSTYNYCYNNPLMFVDPDGMLPTDVIYFNLNGKEVKRTPQEGDDVKKFVLTTEKSSKIVDGLIQSNQVITPFSNTEIDKIDSMYNRHEEKKDKIEQGFIRGTKGESSVVTGTKNGEIKDEWNSARDEISNTGGETLSDVHLHYNLYDSKGNITGLGAFEPSPADVLPSNNPGFTEPSIVLGYDQKEVTTRNDSGTGSTYNATTTTSYAYPRTIGFYDTNPNTNHVNVDWEAFKKVNQKINGK